MIISISQGVLFFGMFVIAMGFLAKYGKFEKVLSCSVRWKGEERPLVRHLVKFVNQLIQQCQGGATDDTGLEQNNEMINQLQ